MNLKLEAVSLACSIVCTATVVALSVSNPLLGFAFIVVVLTATHFGCKAYKKKKKKEENGEKKQLIEE